MPRYLIALLWALAIGLFSFCAFAQEAAEARAETSGTSDLAADLKKARDIILDGSGDNAFARGLLIGLLEPIFIASMFCLGLWAGQMSEKLRHIWVLPMLTFAATLIGAFITVYHSDWKPELNSDNFAFLEHLGSTNAVAVIIGLLVGGAVGMRFVAPPVIALVVVACAGLAIGFSQTSDIGDHSNALIPFWSGFGLTGLLVNIFGIGFETFFQSINLSSVTRAVGIATVILSFMVGMQIF